MTDPPVSDSSSGLSFERGVRYTHLQRWDEFYEFVNRDIIDPHDFVFRGQREAFWKLESSLDRANRDRARPVNIREHLTRFQLATRGRLHREELDKDESNRKWWALGQHFGLNTPLLDWSESPFVALYFAFEEPTPGPNFRAVFALSRSRVAKMSARIAQEQSAIAARSDTLDIFTTMTDDNARLVSQSGLFTECTPGIDIETWVTTHFGEESENPALIRIVIPGSVAHRAEVLRSLQMMNISRLTLFPDLGGSAQFCNMQLSY